MESLQSVPVGKFYTTFSSLPWRDKVYVSDPEVSCVGGFGPGGWMRVGEGTEWLTRCV